MEVTIMAVRAFHARTLEYVSLAQQDTPVAVVGNSRVKIARLHLVSKLTKIQLPNLAKNQLLLQRKIAEQNC